MYDSISDFRKRKSTLVLPVLTKRAQRRCANKCIFSQFSQFIIHNNFNKEKLVEGLILTEAVPEENVVISTETAFSNEKILEKKTIIYETRVDPTAIKVAGEKTKDQLFTRFGILKPKPNEVQFVSIEKYYEPYSMISGRYFIDYLRKCTYHISVDKEVLEVVLLNNKFKPEQSADSSQRSHNEIKLEAEERLKNDVKASLVLDQSGKDVTLEKLPSAPSERRPKKILEKLGAQEIAGDADLSVIRSRIAQRPKDISRIVSELFEVDERAVIYTPRFRVKYRNLKTGEEKTVEFDGVTGERIRESKRESSHSNPLIPPPPPPSP